MVSSCLLIDFDESEAEAIYLEGGVCFVTKEKRFLQVHMSPGFHILRWRRLLSLSEILERDWWPKSSCIQRTQCQANEVLL